jgi:hypothetical protein
VETYYLGGAGISGEIHPDVYKSRRAHGNQHMGSQAPATLPILSLDADESTEHECAQKAHQGVEEIRDGE